MEHTICVFGDSTAWGAWDKEKGGWVNRLWLYLAKEKSGEKYIELYNLSISGGTTEGILKRFEAEARARDADVLIFQTGGNDSAEDGGQGKANVPPERFRENVREIIRRGKQMTDKMMFVGFKNCDESRTTPVSWCNFHYTNANLKKYNNIMKEVCGEEDVPFCDVFGLMTDSDLEDGIHPNASGHEKLFEKIRVALDEQNWI